MASLFEAPDAMSLPNSITTHRAAVIAMDTATKDRWYTDCHCPSGLCRIHGPHFHGALKTGLRVEMLLDTELFTDVLDRDTGFWEWFSMAGCDEPCGASPGRALKADWGGRLSLVAPPLIHNDRGHALARRCISKAIRACESPRPTRVVLLADERAWSGCGAPGLNLCEHIASVESVDGVVSEVRLIQNDAAKVLAPMTWPPRALHWPKGLTLTTHVPHRIGGLRPPRCWVLDWPHNSCGPQPLPFCQNVLRATPPEWIMNTSPNEQLKLNKAIESAFNHDCLAGTLGVLPPSFAYLVASLRSYSAVPSSQMLQFVQGNIDIAQLKLFDGAKAAWALSCRIRSAWWRTGIPDWVVNEEDDRLAVRRHERKRMKADLQFAKSENIRRAKRLHKLRLENAAAHLGLTVAELLHKWPHAKTIIPASWKTWLDEAAISNRMSNSPWKGRLRSNPPKRRLSLEDSWVEPDPTTRKRSRGRFGKDSASPSKPTVGHSERKRTRVCRALNMWKQVP